MRGNSIEPRIVWGKGRFVKGEGGREVVEWLGGWVVGRGVATLVLRWVKHEDMKHEEEEVEPRSHEGHEAGTLERGVVGLIG